MESTVDGYTDEDPYIEANAKKVTALKQEITDIEEQILANLDLKNCPNCGSVIPLKNNFCPECGHEQEKLDVEEVCVEIEEDVETEKVCPNCGEVCAKGTKFCGKCGSKLE